MPDTISSDLYAAAQLITERGLWDQDGAFGADTENGPIDPTAALWLAANGHLPYVFTTTAPGCADAATEMVLTDRRVLAAVELLSANLADWEARIVDEAPVERIAEWVANTPAAEVIGRIVRLAEPTHQLAA